MSDVAGSDANEVTGSPDAALVRAFLQRVLPQPPVTSAGSPAEFESVAEPAAVRSYAITSGRAEGAVHLEIESMLRVTDRGELLGGRLQFEKASIVQLCRIEILSVAELSARLHLPLGVIRVVASDLIVEGMLEAFLPSLNVADDIDLISRLIAGVRAL